MPNVNRIISPYIKSGNPDTHNEPSTTSVPGSYAPYAGGETGMSFDWNDKTYEKVTVDSGATSATAAGAIAANQLAFWKNKTLRLVTNDRTQAIGNAVAQASCNSVAGVFRAAITAGNECCILTRGANIAVKSGAAATAGMLLVADVDANGPQALGVAVGTAAGYQVIGVSRAAAGGGNVNADVDIPSLP